MISGHSVWSGVNGANVSLYRGEIYASHTGRTAAMARSYAAALLAAAKKAEAGQ